MQFISLKFVMNIEGRITIVEADDQSDVDDAILHAVDETAAECVGVERPAHRVDDSSGWKAILRQLPQLFDAEGVDLRIFSGVEIEDAGELFAQRSARTLGQNRDLRADVHARLVVWLSLSELVDSFVTHSDADHSSVL